MKIVFIILYAIFILSCTEKNTGTEETTHQLESMRDLLLSEKYGYDYISRTLSKEREQRFELSKEYYFEGLQLYQNNEIETALLKFEEAIQTCSNQGAFYYHYGLCLMDLCDYYNAEKAFFRASQFCPGTSQESIDEYMHPLYTFDHNGILREKYFAYYNLACLYAITDKLEASMEKIKEALEYGYPYIEHLFNDPDLQKLYNTSPDIQNQIRTIYENGFINTILGERYEHSYGSTEIVYFFIDKENITKTHITTSPPVFYGTYEIINYHIMIKYHKKSGQRGYGDMIAAVGNGGVYEYYESYEQNIEKYEILSIKEMLSSEEWEKM